MRNYDPLVCICLPTYNAEKTVAETLQSIVGQTYKNLIIQVVDNASTDRTLDIVRKFSDPRIEIYQGSTNVGGEGNFNRCIELAKGDYTAIYHADDIYEPTMVACQVAEFEAGPDVGAVFSEAKLINESNKPIGSVTRPASLKRKSHHYEFIEIFRAILRHGNFLICPSAMVRTSIYRDEIKRFRSELFGSGADGDVWLRILQRHSISILPDQLIRYRISPSQGSHTINRLRTKRADFFRVVDYYLSQDVIKAEVSQSDLSHYGWQQRRDRVVRAVNYLLQDNAHEAYQLCRDIPSIDSLRAAMVSKAGLITLILGIYLRFAMALGMTKAGKVGLQRIRRITNR
jgi:glycosyltransferase involved in cell wall biosynthesis